MSVSPYQVIFPGRKRGKRAIVKIVLFILGRSIQSASRFDKKIQQELETFKVVHESIRSPKTTDDESK